MSKTYSFIKKLILALFAAFLLFWVVRINVIEIGKNDNSPQTVNASKSRNITYFSDFSMETFDGGSFSSDDLANAKITVFNAWGPYCTNCLDEMPYLEEISNEYKDRGLQIVGIQSDAYQYPEDMELARSEAAAAGVTYPLLIADSDYNGLVRPMLMNALPGTWIVDADGKILDFVQGGKTKAAWIEYFEMYLN